MSEDRDQGPEELPVPLVLRPANVHQGPDQEDVVGRNEQEDGTVEAEDEQEDENEEPPGRLLIVGRRSGIGLDQRHHRKKKEQEKEKEGFVHFANDSLGLEGILFRLPTK
jgi:hypothetical protein